MSNKSKSKRKNQAQSARRGLINGQSTATEQPVEGLPVEGLPGSVTNGESAVGQSVGENLSVAERETPTTSEQNTSSTNETPQPTGNDPNKRNWKKKLESVFWTTKHNAPNLSAFQRRLANAGQLVAYGEIGNYAVPIVTNGLIAPVTGELDNVPVPLSRPLWKQDTVPSQPDTLNLLPVLIDGQTYYYDPRAILMMNNSTPGDSLPSVRAENLTINELDSINLNF